MLSLKRVQAGDLLKFTKGIAILLIYFHHYSRSVWLSRGLPTPTLMQWNFAPSGEDFGVLASAIRDGRYSEVFLRLMASFGYVGVHLFVLMSGMGLALGTPELIGTGAFLKRRILRIVPPFWLAVAVFAILDWVAGHPYSVGRILERMLLLTTFDAKRFFIIDSPLWCLAVFFQLYLLFLPLRRLIVNYGMLSLLSLAVIGFIARWLASLPSILNWNEYFGHTVALNWLAVFGFGIWVGNRLRMDGEIALSAWGTIGTTLICVLLVVLSEVSASAYPIHDTAIAVLIGMVTFLAWRVLTATPFAQAFAAVGAVSFPFYLYHRPIVAKVINLWFARSVAGSLPPLILGIALATGLVLLLLLVQRALHRSPRIAAWTVGV
jgi:peptidoglycan/LPS O-acetylase OafA/YrhL